VDGIQVGHHTVWKLQDLKEEACLSLDESASLQERLGLGHSKSSRVGSTEACRCSAYYSVDVDVVHSPSSLTFIA
jgi:hypothetical protein